MLLCVILVVGLTGCLSKPRLDPNTVTLKDPPKLTDSDGIERLCLTTAELDDMFGCKREIVVAS